MFRTFMSNRSVQRYVLLAEAHADRIVSQQRRAVKHRSSVGKQAISLLIWQSLDYYRMHDWGFT
ncbi:hypothetical protein ACVWWN_004564 [Mycobacterium sp. URHB0021]